MKMQPDHFVHLKLHVNSVLFADPNMRKRYKKHGFSTKRLQWDCVRDAGLMPWIVEVLYKYLDDTHIQTALDKIIQNNG